MAGKPPTSRRRAGHRRSISRSPVRATMPGPYRRSRPPRRRRAGRRRRPCRPAAGRRCRAAPATAAGGVAGRAAATARQTRSGESGMSRWRTPRWASASITAFCTAGVAPIVPGLADALGAERVERRRRLGGVDLEAGQLGGARATGSRSASRCGGCRRRRRRRARSSAWATPEATPPCCWPATSSGLTRVPQSSTATWRSRSTSPVSGSTSTTAMWAPKGNVAPPWSKSSWAARPSVPSSWSTASGASAAAAASSAQLSARAGTPATPRPPSSCDDDVVGGGLEQVGGQRRGPWPARPRWRAAPPTRRSAASGSRRCRRPVRTWSVSDWTRLIRSTGMPRRSATIMANVVAWPWPWADVPAVTMAEPSGWTSTAAYSAALPPAVIST